MTSSMESHRFLRIKTWEEAEWTNFQDRETKIRTYKMLYTAMKWRTLDQSPTIELWDMKAEQEGQVPRKIDMH